MREICSSSLTRVRVETGGKNKVAESGDDLLASLGPLGAGEVEKAGGEGHEEGIEVALL